MKRVIVIQLIILTIGLSIGVTSGGVLSRDQLAIDINHYDLRIKVDTKRKMIAGYVDIKMKILDEIRFIELDLIKQYFISKILIDSVSTPFNTGKIKFLLQHRESRRTPQLRLELFIKENHRKLKNLPGAEGLHGKKAMMDILGLEYRVREMDRIYGFHVKNTLAMSQTVLIYT